MSCQTLKFLEIFSKLFKPIVTVFKNAPGSLLRMSFENESTNFGTKFVKKMVISYFV